jgi:hypothetical protein
VEAVHVHRFEGVSARRERLEEAPQRGAAADVERGDILNRSFMNNARKMAAAPGPSMEKARIFFRRFALPRRCRVDGDVVNNGGPPGGAGKKKNYSVSYRIARAGDSNSELFPILASESEMGPFGVGMGLYFAQLRWLALAFLCYGALCVRKMVYFSTTYDESDGSYFSANVNVYPGSAVCLDYETVTVKCEGESDSYCPPSAIYTNTCQVRYSDGLLDFVGIVLLILFSFYLRRIQRKEQEILDESVQTSADYSIVINDPGPDDDDPYKWSAFFGQFGEVAYVTIARANGVLLKALTQRRAIKLNINIEHLPSAAEAGLGGGRGERAGPGERAFAAEESTALLAAADGNEGQVRPSFLQCLGFRRDENYWRGQLEEINTRIEVLSKKSYPVTKVYVTFNTEEGQRECLRALTTGACQAACEHGNLSQELIFEGNVLHVQEALEPTDILWHNLELDWVFCTFQNILASACTLGLVYASYVILVDIKEQGSPGALALVVTAINSLLPMVCNIITSLERHHNDGARQNSLYMKLLWARFMNTAMINFMTTPFGQTLAAEEMKAVQALLISDAFLTPAVALLDISGTIQRNVLSRFSATQKKMNSYWMGSVFSLAERYTSMSKTVFVALFYATVYPLGLLFAAFGFAFTYLVDRYRLFRLWRKGPAYNAQLAKSASRVLIGCTLVSLLISSNWYTGWPFDSAWAQPDGSFVYADKKSLVDSPLDYFNIITAPWMSGDQQKLVRLYGYATLLLLAAVAAWYIYAEAHAGIRHLFIGHYDEVGQSQEIPFDRVSGIQAYIPMSVPGNALVGPLIACETHNLDPEHYPSQMHVEEDEFPSQAFERMNVALEFPEPLRSRLFGLVHGFLPALSPIFTQAAKLEPAMTPTRVNLSHPPVGLQSATSPLPRIYI